MSVGERRSWLHPLVGSSLPNWAGSRLRYGPVQRPGLMQAAVISSVVTAGIPIRWYERLRYGRAIAQEKLDPPPVFIIGHWRSGTTNLHNHLLQDPQFACVSFLQCLIPWGFLSLDWLVKALIEKRLAPTRPMDQVPTGLKEPMSEDFALGSMTDLTHYHSYYYPQQADEVFRRTILFEGVSEKEIAGWSRQYLYLLKKVAYASGGRQLLLKNPAHTGRIPALLKLFPNAKFIYVARNPLPVHASTCKLLDRFLELFSLQKYDLSDVSRHVLWRYRLLIEKYLRDRALIPQGQLVEIRHEDMVTRPLEVLERVYSDLQLPGFATTRPRIEQYVGTLKDYKTNSYRFDPDTVSRVTEACDFAMQEWGYEAA